MIESHVPIYFNPTVPSNPPTSPTDILKASEELADKKRIIAELARKLGIAIKFPGE